MSEKAIEGIGKKAIEGHTVKLPEYPNIQNMSNLPANGELKSVS